MWLIMRCCFPAEEVTDLELIATVLQPFQQPTTMLSSEKSPSISLVQPVTLVQKGTIPHDHLLRIGAGHMGLTNPSLYPGVKHELSA